MDRRRDLIDPGVLGWLAISLALGVMTAALLGSAVWVVPFVLILDQPDLGTALMICAGGATVMFLAGVPLRLFVGGAAALAVGLVPLLIIAEQGRVWGWGSGRAVICYVIGALGIAAFVAADTVFALPM